MQSKLTSFHAKISQLSNESSKSFQLILQEALKEHRQLPATSPLQLSLKGLDEEARQNQTSYNKQYAHLLASRRSRISNLLGRGGVKWVENALARGGKSLANATEEEVNVIIKKLQSTCPGRKAYKTMSAEEESQLNEKISSRHQESLKKYDECLGNEFIERTGEWKDRKTGKWSVEEIKIIMDAEEHWNSKNMYQTLASRLEGRGSHQVGDWICRHRKNVLRGLQLA